MSGKQNTSTPSTAAVLTEYADIKADEIRQTAIFNLAPIMHGIAVIFTATLTGNTLSNTVLKIPADKKAKITPAISPDIYVKMHLIKTIEKIRFLSAPRTNILLSVSISPKTSKNITVGIIKSTVDTAMPLYDFFKVSVLSKLCIIFFRKSKVKIYVFRYRTARNNTRKQHYVKSAVKTRVCK